VANWLAMTYALYNLFNYCTTVLHISLSSAVTLLHRLTVTSAASAAKLFSTSGDREAVYMFADAYAGVMVSVPVAGR